MFFNFQIQSFNHTSKLNNKYYFLIYFLINPTYHHLFNYLKHYMYFIIPLIICKHFRLFS